MRRYLLPVLFPALILAVANAQPADQPQQEQNMKQQEVSPSCDCCLQCEAARRSQLSAEEEQSGGTPKNGCRKCCIKCGKELPMKEQKPPERHAPPEKRENK